MDLILKANDLILEAHRRDFSNPRSTPIEQPGPTYTSRTMAMAHLAAHDAYVQVAGGGTAYLPGLPAAPAGLVAGEAAVGAAVAVLKGLYRTQHAAIDAQAGPISSASASYGATIGEAMLKHRAGDGHDHPMAGLSNPAVAPAAPFHKADPFAPDQRMLGASWGAVSFFGATAMPNFTPHPAPDSADYTADFVEVKAKGAAPGSLGLTRTPEETLVGLFWAYDGARLIGTPPRLFNQVVRAIAAKVGTSEAENARLFALINMAMADAGIASWNEKYLFNLWRPVVGIREHADDFGAGHAGSPPTGQTLTAGPVQPSVRGGDPFWAPLGLPVTNVPGELHRTPNFPAYPSGHATFGAACFNVAAAFLEARDPSFDRESFNFEFASDELDGRAIDSTGHQRVYHRRGLTIPQCIAENMDSRVWLGVHWRFDSVEGNRVGEQIAEQVKDLLPTT